jgi:putative ABC transport system ATP-binding protein
MVFQSMLWCLSGRRRVATSLAALVSRWKQFFRRNWSRGDMVIQDRQVFPVASAQVIADPLDVTHPIDQQETQVCKAVVPVTDQQQCPLAPAPFLVVHDLKKAYVGSAAARLVLNDISLSVEQGEFVIITGPSGAGKSVLLRVLGCMERPSKGEYWLAERKINLFPMDKLAILRNQQLGFIFQQPDLLPHTSVLKNVALPLLYAGFSQAEQKRRAQKVLRAVGLNTRLLHTPEQLSRGQQQRVAIARAVVNSPALLLADEPTGNMDVRNEREIMAVLQALNQRKLTIILVTRNVDLAVYATRHIMLRDGYIIADEPVANTQRALDDLEQPVTINEMCPISVQIRGETL